MSPRELRAFGVLLAIVAVVYIVGIALLMRDEFFLASLSFMTGWVWLDVARVALQDWIARNE